MSVTVNHAWALSKTSDPLSCRVCVHLPTRPINCPNASDNFLVLDQAITTLRTARFSGLECTVYTDILVKRTYPSQKSVLNKFAKAHQNAIQRETVHSEYHSNTFYPWTLIIYFCVYFLGTHYIKYWLVDWHIWGTMSTTQWWSETNHSSPTHPKDTTPSSSYPSLSSFLPTPFPKATN